MQTEASRLGPEPPDAAIVHFGALRNLGTLREMVGRWATDAGLDRDRVNDAQLAVSELAANSVLHGGGHGRLSVWRDDDALVCELRDHGWLAQPLGDPEPPDPIASAGRGLWLVARLSDDVAHQPTSDGVRVRVTFRRDAGKQ